MPCARAAASAPISQGSIAVTSRQQAGAGVLGEIVRAHDEAGQPRVDVVRRARDRLRPQDRERRLDHGPDSGALRSAELAQAQAHRRESFGRRHLRHEDRIGRRGDGCRKIGLAPGRLERVDANHQLPACRSRPPARRRRPARAPRPSHRAPPRPRGRRSPRPRQASWPSRWRGRWSRACRARCDAGGSESWRFPHGADRF